MIMHHQKKDLGLKFQGDSIEEKKVDIYKENEINKLKEKNFKIVDINEYKNLMRQPKSNNPRYIKMAKKYRTIEQEETV